MKSLQRLAGILFLLALLTSMGIVSAQDSEPISVVGSGIVVPFLEAAANTSDTPPLAVTITGTSNGFAQFCQNIANVTASTRTITAAEDALCAQNNVEYIELLVGHHIIAFIARPDARYNQCLTATDLNAVFAPSAQGQTNWQQVAPENPDVPLSVYVPQSNSPIFSVLDNLISGDGIRVDANSQPTDDAIIAAVSGEVGAIGVVSFRSAVAAGDRVKLLEISTNDAVGCTVPSIENVEANAYTAADELFVYVNQSLLETPTVKELLTLAGTDQAAALLEELGFAAPSAAVYTKNQAALEGDGDSRPFSSAATSYEIPFDVAGTVTIAGATSGREYLDNASSQFQSLYQQVTVDVKTEGSPAGIRRLCNGEVDIAVVDGDMSADQRQNCDANTITTLSIDLGRQAVVLIGNANSSQLACLTTEQIQQTWESRAEDPITTWNTVDSRFPEQAITLFAPNTGDSTTDLLMISAAGTDIPTRNDTEFSDDPLYRAAAVANVEGGLTYMSWADYQRVAANQQERIQLVSADAGSGCVAPNAETIADGSYPLTRSATLLVNEKSLSKPPVQSFLWFLASDANYGLLEQSGLLGVSFGSLLPLRDTLELRYVDAEQASAAEVLQPTTEETPDATEPSS